ncbi:hypothetical protein COCMIDRAFT_93499, partial [Bipolaris oryzae ATCC 44560]
IDKASQALTRRVPPDVSKLYRALADHSGVPRATIHHHANSRRSIEEKALKQKYLHL